MSHAQVQNRQDKVFFTYMHRSINLLMCNLFTSGTPTVQFQQGNYVVVEGNSIQVCAMLNLPVGASALGCDIAVTFGGIPGPIAGLLC